MATKPATKEEKWAKKPRSLRKAIKRLGLPCVVQLDSKRAEIERFGLRKGTFLKLEKQCLMMTVRVRAAVNRVYGTSKEFEGNEFLLPIGYSGKVKLIQPETDQRSFQQISEVMEAFPKFVLVEEDIDTIFPGQGTATIPRGTQLALDKVVPDPRNPEGEDSDILLCIYRGSICLFTPDQTCNFTVLPDNTAYSLSRVVDHVQLPQTVKFQDVDPAVVVSRKDEEAMVVLELLRDYVTIVGFCDTKFLVSLCQNAEIPTNLDVVLIPYNIESLNAEILHFPKKTEWQDTRHLLQTHFPESTDLGFIEEKLYLHEMKQTEAIYLQPLTTEEYICPERQPIPGVPSGLLARLRLRFHSGSNGSQAKDRKSKALPPKEKEEPHRKEQAKKGSRNAPERSGQIKEPIRYVQDPTEAKPKQTLSSERNEYPTDPSLSDPGGDYATIPCDVFTNQLSGKAHPPHFDDDSGGYVNLNHIVNDNISGPYYVSLTGQFATDKRHEFSRYSVDQVVDVFKSCQMPNLAKVCEEEILDGSFIVTMSGIDFSMEPFNLSKFHISKVEKIICGWRPQMGSHR